MPKFEVAGFVNINMDSGNSRLAKLLSVEKGAHGLVGEVLYVDNGEQTKVALMYCTPVEDRHHK